MNRSRRLLPAALAVLLLWNSACSSPAPAPGRKPPPRNAEVKILHFYASPGVVAPGEATTVCYGVENATSVELSPPVEPLKPFYNRCFSFAPKTATELTLTARGASGQATAAITIGVDRRAARQPAAPKAEPAAIIRFFTASSTTVTRGTPVTVCYGLSGAVSVRVEPALDGVEAVKQKCVSFTPQSTTTYTMTAVSAGGQTDSASLTIRVE